MEQLRIRLRMIMLLLNKANVLGSPVGKNNINPFMKLEYRYQSRDGERTVESKEAGGGKAYMIS